MLLAGCTAESSVDDESLEDISETPDTNEESDPGSAPEEIIEVGESGYCDDTNQVHCMLPFPSGAFLSEDSSQDTGYRLTIDGQAIPDSRSAVSDNLVILDRLDGFSPSTQIFTAFDEVPNITGMASQLADATADKQVPQWSDIVNHKKDFLKQTTEGIGSMAVGT